VLETVPRIAEIYDEPFANSSALPAYLCALQAKRAGVDLLLAGDGGDELFAGNSRYLYDRVFDRYALLPSGLRRGILEPLIDRARWIEQVPILRKAGNYVRLARASVVERLCSDNIFRHFSAGEIFASAFLDQIDQSLPLRFADEIFGSAGAASKIQSMMFLDLRLTLADSDLRKVGRMCELAGVRVRFPFLDDELAEFSGQISAGALMRNGALRGFYKSALKDLLPGEILSKPKKGFGLPYTALLASYAPLNDLACDSLQSLKARAWFTPAFLDGMIRITRSEEPSQISGLVWDLMVLEHWLRAHARGGSVVPGRLAQGGERAISRRV